MSVVPEYSWKGISGQLADRGLDIRDYLGLVPKFKRVIRSIALPAGLERATQNFAPLLQALALPGPAPMNKRRHPPSRFFFKRNEHLHCKDSSAAATQPFWSLS